MGYVPPRTEYKLDFSRTEYDGLEVVTRSASMATLLAILELAEQAEEAATGAEALRKLDELFGLFGTVLVSWNVETETGDPVPPTKAGMLGQDSGFLLALIQMWAGEMTQAPPTSPTASGHGATSAPEGLAEASRPSSSGPRSLPAWPGSGTARRARSWRRTPRTCGCVTYTSWLTRRREVIAEWRTPWRSWSSPAMTPRRTSTA